MDKRKIFLLKEYGVYVIAPCEELAILALWREGIYAWRNNIQEVDSVAPNAAAKIFYTPINNVPNNEQIKTLG